MLLCSSGFVSSPACTGRMFCGPRPKVHRPSNISHTSTRIAVASSCLRFLHSTFMQVEVFDFYTHESNTITCRTATKRRATKVGKTPLADDQHHLCRNGLLWCKFEGRHLSGRNARMPFKHLHVLMPTRPISAQT